MTPSLYEAGFFVFNRYDIKRFCRNTNRDRGVKYMQCVKNQIISSLEQQLDIDAGVIERLIETQFWKANSSL